MAIGTTRAEADPRPVLVVTNHAPAFRIGAFARLHEQEGAVFALIGGNVRHGGGSAPDAALPFPVLRPAQREIYRLAASGRHRAVVAGLSGRLAPAAAWRGARHAGVPFVLWATLWAHPRTAAHLAGYPLVRRLYRDADAVITYGPHVSEYVRGKRPRGPVFEAPQAVDDAFWEDGRIPSATPRFKSCSAAASTRRRASGCCSTPGGRRVSRRPPPHWCSRATDRCCPEHGRPDSLWAASSR
jgi:hypothetical protein